MGGNAFQQPGPQPSSSTFPRMSPKTYFSHRDSLAAKLRKVYDRVVCPPEAPEKIDYGDIDFFVSGPLTNVHTGDANEASQVVDSARLMAHLGAIQERSNGPCVRHFAIPLQTPIIGHRLMKPQSKGDPQPHSEVHLFQVDVNDCFGQRSLEWASFKNSYGAMWQILGIIVKPFGLTADGEGLKLRLEEIENTVGGKNKCRLQLTADVNEVLEFLGLDVDKFYTGFSSCAALFEWIASCNLFQAALFLPTKNNDPAGADAKAQMASELSVESEQASNTLPMKRRHYQPLVAVFRLWVVENRNVLNETGSTREAVCKQALIRFDRGAEADAMLCVHRRNVREEALRCEIGKAIMQVVKCDGLEKAAAAEKTKWMSRGLRKYLQFDNERLPTFKDDPNAKAANWIDCALGEKGLLAWVVKNASDIEERHIQGKQKALVEQMRKKKQQEKCKQANDEDGTG